MALAQHVNYWNNVILSGSVDFNKSWFACTVHLDEYSRGKYIIIVHPLYYSEDVGIQIHYTGAWVHTLQ